MAEKNKSKNKLTPFQQEQIEVANQILDYKLSAESNVVSILYKNPDEFYNVNLTLNDFHNNVWKVYFQIAYDIIVVEGKSSLDDVVVGIYLEKHPKLREKYEEYGGYNTVLSVMDYVKEENLYAYITELKKWQIVLQLTKYGFPVKDKLSKYVDMTQEQIYNDLEIFLNHTFVNMSEEVKSYNIFENMHEFVDELINHKDAGMPFHNAKYLTEVTGGFNLNGHIYGLGAGSGVGKSTMAFNYLFPSALEYNKKMVFIINEEDEKKFKKELLIWVANNIFKQRLQKKTIRDGGDKDGKFTDDTLQLLKQCADWIEEKKDKKILTVIPLERYSVNTVVKIIKKYSSAFGIKIFVLDTLKESFDAKTDEIYKSMMRDMITLYDTVKPSAKNVGLFVTYQLGKGSLKIRYLTNNEIGQAKSIIDVMSVNLMMRRPYDDEYKDCGNNEIEYYHWDIDRSGYRKQVFNKLDKEKNYMITFVTKNRFGETDAKQIVSECDLSTNIYQDVGYCKVKQDF